MADDEKKESKSPAKGSELYIPEPDEDVEIGAYKNMPFSTRYENAWEVQRADEVTVEKLIAMRNMDGQARALYSLITLPIRSALDAATFQVDAGVKGGAKETKFIEQMFTLPRSAGGMEIPFNKFIAQMLLAISDGFSAFEIVYQTPDTGPLKGKWTIKKLAYRSPETLTFLMDDKGSYAGLRQRVHFKGEYRDVRLSKDHTFYYACNEEENPFYGRSLFNSAFWHWDKKVKLEYIMSIASQRAAVGTRVGEVKEGASPKDQEKFRRALAQLGLAQHIMVPTGYKVTSLQETGSFDFLGVVNYHNSQMSKSVLANWFDQNQGAGKDDGTLVDFGKQSDALFLLMLKTIMDDIANVINNQIIPRFIDWNFGSGKYPTFRWGELTPDQKQSLRDTFDKLMSGKTSPEFDLAIEEKYASDTLGLEIDYDGLRGELLERKEQEKMIAEAQAQQAAMGAALGGDPATSQTLGEAQAGGATNLPAGTGPGGAPAATPTAGAPAEAAPPAEGAPETPPSTPSSDDTTTLDEIPANLLPPGFKLTEAEGEAV